MLHQQQAQQPAQRPYLNQDATENERRFQGIRKDTRDTTLEAVAASPAVGEDMTITTEGKRQVRILIMTRFLILIYTHESIEANLETAGASCWSQAPSKIETAKHAINRLFRRRKPMGFL